MQPGAAPVRTDILLVGGGHAHVEVLRRFGMRPEPGVRLTLVAREPLTPYSGMVPGLTAGHYGHDEAHIDLAPLATFAGARLVLGEVHALDPVRREVQVAGRPSIGFDLASLDIGSEPSTAGIEGAEHALAVKPVDRFLEGWSRIETQVIEAGGNFRLLVVGAGAGGVELALSLRHRLRTRLSDGGLPPHRPQVAIASADDHILPAHARPTRRRLSRALAADGIKVLTGRRIRAVGPDAAVDDRGRRVPCDAAILVTPGAPAPWVAAAGLATDRSGFLRVGPTLQSVSDPAILAAGDVADFSPRRLAKAGVYAVRQGPVLAANLRNLANGRPPRPYRPQSRVLALISTGRKRAVVSWGGLSLSGGWAWRWKDRIDRRWIAKYRDLPTMQGASPGAGEEAPEMRCGGCGAKIAADVLSRVLADLDIPSRPDVLVGLGDDAAVVAPPPGQVSVRTADQFRAFIDDPWLFGRIAANHALGDLYAMGAAPATALAMVTLPHAPAGKLERDLRDLMSGALEVLNAAGCILVGGHSAEGAELSLGFALDGYGAREELTRKGGLRPGDVLMLTKPLGTGILLAAHMRRACRASWLDAALAAMQQSSCGAAAVLRAHGARAVSDVTGFGVAGHLGEMLRASGASATIDTRSLPLLPGVGALSAKGFRSTLHDANAFMADGGAPVLFDPQTAGGLLAGIPPSRAADCLSSLHGAGFGGAAIIGRVDATARGWGTITLA